MKRILFSAALAALLSLSAPAMGNVHDTFGIGARSIGMGNMQVTSVTGGAAAYYNPAALGRVGSVMLDVGFQSFVPRFPDFEGIVYDRNQNGYIDFDEDGNPETTTVGTQYPPSMGTAFNVAIPIFSWMTAGVSAYMPTQYLMRLQFEDPYIPYYALYKNRTQRFSMHFGLGIKVFDGLYIGLGASSSATTRIEGSLTTNISVDANPTDENGEPLPNQVDVAANADTLSVEMSGSTALNAGILFNFGWLADPLAGLNLGAAYRAMTFVEAYSDISAMAYGSFTLSNDTLYSGPLAEEPIQNQSLTQSSFNPAQFVAGVSYSLRDRITFGIDVTWIEWSTYQETFISSTSVSSNPSSEVNVQIGRDLANDPGLNWHNTLNPKIGFEYQGGMPRGRELGFGIAIRGGYGFSPSPVPNQSERANMMDSDKHVLSGGLGFKIPLSRLPNPLRVDLFVSYHILEERIHFKDVTMVSAEEGYYPPGYPVGGSITSKGSVAGFGGTASLMF